MLSVAFSSDGTKLAAGGIDFSVIIWDMDQARGVDLAKPIELKPHAWFEAAQRHYMAHWQLDNKDEDPLSD